MKANKLSLTALIIVILSIFFFNSTNIPDKIFAYDNWGFYMYLPNIFIENKIAPENNDFLHEINSKYELSPTLYQISKTEDGVWVIRFFSGISILLLPFFFIGHLIASFTNYPTDGYSAPYFYSIWIAAPFYASLGLYLLRKVLLKYLDDIVVAISLLTLYFATNFFFFSSLGNPFPHVFVFTEYALLLWFTIKWHEKFEIKYARLIGLMIGLLTISRLSEIISLFIPLLWGIYDKKTLMHKLELIRVHKKQLYQLVLFTFLGGLPQILYWYVTTGSIYFNAYNDASSQLVLSAPQFIKVLFSYRKGWFIYSPIMIFSVIGFIFLYKNKKDLFWPIIIVFLINLYLIASFTSLNSYGYRAFIQSYAFMIIPFAFLIQFIVKKTDLLIKILLIFLLITAGYFTYFQAKQTQMGTIHGSRMTKEYYWAIFMKMYPSEKDKELLLIQRSSTGNDQIKNESKYKRKIEIFEDFESPTNSVHYDTSIVYNGKFSYFINENIEYGPTYELAYRDITDDYFAYFRSSVYVFPDYPINDFDVLLVFSFENNGKPYKYRKYNLNDPKFNIKSGQWGRVYFDYLSPEILDKDDKIKLYIWNIDKQRLYIDNVQVESFTRDLN